MKKDDSNALLLKASVQTGICPEVLMALCLLKGHSKPEIFKRALKDVVAHRVSQSQRMITISEHIAV